MALTYAATLSHAAAMPSEQYLESLQPKESHVQHLHDHYFDTHKLEVDPNDPSGFRWVSIAKRSEFDGFLDLDTFDAQDLAPIISREDHEPTDYDDDSSDFDLSKRAAPAKKNPIITYRDIIIILIKATQQYHMNQWNAGKKEWEKKPLPYRILHHYPPAPKISWVELYQFDDNVARMIALQKLKDSGKWYDLDHPKGGS